MNSSFMDTQLFIDMQYVQSFDGWDWDVRVPYFTDRNGKETFFFSSLVMELRSERVNQMDRAEDHHAKYIAARLQVLRDFKQKLKNNLREPGRQDRFMFFTRHDRAYVKDLLKDFGQSRNDLDAYDIARALNEIACYSQQIASRCFDHYSDSNYDLFRCSDCGEYCHCDNSHNTNDGDVCDSCVDNYRWSECMEEYINDSDAYAVYDTCHSARNGDADDWCTYRYGQRNFFEIDGGFISDEDEYCDYESEDDEDDYDNDYYERERERREREAYLPHYHSTRRVFKEINEDGKYPALGVELEVWVPDRREMVNSFFDTYGRNFEQILLERDGSLDSEHGVEIVTQPFGRSEWDEFAPDFIEQLHEHHAVGYNEPAGTNYGIHITVHRRNFSPLAEARIAMFLADVNNNNFVRAIAQRSAIYSQASGSGMGSTVCNNVRSITSNLNNVYHRKDVDRSGNLPTQKKIAGRGKYCSVNWKGDLAEFRIFQSTTNESSFMKNLEFVWALHAWTKPEAATGNSFNYMDFLKWLNTPEHRHEFPTLMKYLSKKVFYGTNYPPIISSWQGLMTKPVETNAVEPMAA